MNISKSYCLLAFSVLVSIQGFAQTAKSYTQEGIKLYENQQYSEAIINFNKAIEADVKYSQAYFYRGNIKDSFEDRHGAMQDYNKAIDLNPKFSEALFARGNVKFLLQDYYGAIADYSKTIQLNPNHIDAYYKRGQAKHRLEAYEDAINDCTKIIEITPKNIDAYYLRGILRLDYGQTELGCLDLSKAGELGDLKAYEVIRDKCNTRIIKEIPQEEDEESDN
ncbi:MAG: tetratricopeptide repeat protein [Bacteroidota bacterium]